MLALYISLLPSLSLFLSLFLPPPPPSFSLSLSLSLSLRVLDVPFRVLDVPVREKLLHINVQWFRGGLAFKAQKKNFVSLISRPRAIKKKKRYPLEFETKPP